MLTLLLRMRTHLCCWSSQSCIKSRILRPMLILKAPTSKPSDAPTTNPTTAPSGKPTAAPTVVPTKAPNDVHTHKSTAVPTVGPSACGLGSADVLLVNPPCGPCLIVTHGWGGDALSADVATENADAPVLLEFSKFDQLENPETVARILKAPTFKPSVHQQQTQPLHQVTSQLQHQP